MFWDEDQHDRYAEIFGHLILHRRSESFAESWEKGESKVEQMTAAERRQHDRLFQMYVEDVGVHPLDRHELKQSMNAEIWKKCQRKLGQIISDVNGRTRHCVDPSLAWQNPNELGY